MWDLPEWVFLLDFLFKNPRRGLSRLFYSSHTQFSLRDFSISFRVEFSTYFDT